MKRLLFWAILMVSPSVFYSQNLLFETVDISYEHESLDSEFLDYDVFRIDLPDLNHQLRSFSDPNWSIVIPNLLSSNINLNKHQIFSPSYVLQTASGEEFGANRHKPMTFRAVVEDTEKAHLRITVNNGFFGGLLRYRGETYFFDQLDKFIDDVDEDLIVVYNMKDVKSDGEHKCGVDEVEEFIEKHLPDNDNLGFAVCKGVEIALATDWTLHQEQGSTTAVEDEVTNILNNVQTNFDDEFDDELDYEIVTIWVSDCSSCDPWNMNTIGTALTTFRNWGNGGNFGVTFDVATLWSNKSWGGVIGLAYLNGVCNSNKYNVCDHYTNNNSLLRVLQSHELGHNWSSGHDPGGTPFIMAPAINNTNNWSAQSVNAINNYVASRTCLGSCTPQLPPDAEIDVEFEDVCIEGTVQFIDRSINNPTEWDWTFEGGTPSSSDEQFPKVTYNDPGIYSVTLEASNDNGSSEVFEINYISVGENGQDILECINFEDGLEDWTIENPDGDVTWQLTTVLGASYGNDALYLNNFDYDAAGERDALVSPIIDLSGRTTAQLYLEYAYARYSNTFRDSLIIYVSTDGGSTYPNRIFAATENGSGNFATHGQTTSEFIPQVGSDWCLSGFGPDCMILDITDYVGNEDVRIKMENYTGFGNNMYLDNIRIISDCLPSEPPVAAFIGDPTTGCIPMTVQYTDLSTGVISERLWTFEGGTPASSTEANPLVVYTNSGVFDVSLVVSNFAGESEAFESEYIVADAEPVANFTYTADGLEVIFTNLSEFGQEYSWNFGDGEFSSEVNPVHVYDMDGLYTVILTVFNYCNTVSISIQVPVITPPTADFDSDVQDGCALLAVSFINNCSPNTTGFDWVFEGGSPVNSQQYEPTVVYNDPGVYGVTLVATNMAGNDEIIKEEFITVLGPPTADFDFSIDGNTVMFENMSNGADSYDWDFGDMNSSIEENPTHTYDEDGEYTVTLTVENDCGTDLIEVLIVISNLPIAGFSIENTTGCVPYTVLFENESSSNVESWEWTFPGGNPASSSEENPEVTYNSVGTYDVELIVENMEGKDTLFFSDYITVLDVPVADFGSDINDLNVQFINTSLYGDTYEWDFGDNLMSIQENPLHSYAVAGNYQVTLIVTGFCGKDTVVQEIVIIDQPIAGFQSDIQEGCVPLTVQFQNISSPNTISVEWTFEGGNPMTSIEFNPEVVYENAGTFDVTLIAFSVNSTDTIVMEDHITVGDIPDGDYSVSGGGLIFDFANLSEDAVSYAWDFGDNMTSIEENPNHEYEDPGMYEVCLIATNECGSDTVCQQVLAEIAPRASYSSSTEVGCIPFEITFMDMSNGNPTSWEWTFEGGNPASSIEQNPTVTYETAGDFEVKLVVENGAGSDSIVNNIIALDIPIADYDLDADSTEVQFQNESLWATEFFWDFGDNMTSIEENPTHVYEELGIYEVTLIVSNICGEDTITKTVNLGSVATIDVDNFSAFSLFPNPTENLVYINVIFQENQTNVQLEILDLMGRVIWLRNLNEAKEISASLDLANKANGLYLLRLSTTNFEYLHKIEKID